MPVLEALARVHAHMTADAGAMPPDASDWVLVAAAFAGFVAAWWMFVRGLIVVFSQPPKGEKKRA